MQDDNSLTAIGKGLILLGKYFRNGKLIFVGSSQMVRTWAVKQSGTSWQLILLHKTLNVTHQDITLSSCSSSSAVSAVWQLTGTDYTDSKPTLRQLPNTTVTIANGVLSIALPPVSITAIEF